MADGDLRRPKIFAGGVAFQFGCVTCDHSILVGILLIVRHIVTLSWESKPLYGTPPAGRGYRKFCLRTSLQMPPSTNACVIRFSQTDVAVLHDSRLLISGGYDGHVHFGDLYALELASCAYLPQVVSLPLSAAQLSFQLIFNLLCHRRPLR